MRVVVVVFVWMLMAYTIYREHKEVEQLKKDLSLLILEFEESKKKRMELMKKLIE
jgi:hypothetical protein